MNTSDRVNNLRSACTKADLRSWTNRSHQPFSCGHHLVGTLVLHDMHWTLHTGLCVRHNAPSNSVVAHQQGNYSNNKLSRYLVGTLTSHWWPLFYLEALLPVGPEFKPIHFYKTYGIMGTRSQHLRVNMHSISYKLALCFILSISPYSSPHLDKRATRQGVNHVISRVIQRYIDGSVHIKILTQLQSLGTYGLKTCIDWVGEGYTDFHDSMRSTTLIPLLSLDMTLILYRMIFVHIDRCTAIVARTQSIVCVWGVCVCIPFSQW